MAPRSSKIIAGARVSAISYRESLPAVQVLRRRTCDDVNDVCERMLALRPPRKPTAPLVADEGGIIFTGFPKSQTLHNYYRPLLGIWRRAYRDIVDIAVTRPVPDALSASIDEDDLGGVDAGTRGNVMLLQNWLRELQNRNNNLTRYISENIPATVEGPIQSTGPLINKVADWLERLDSGISGFEVDEIGVKVSRLNKVGSIVMEGDLLEALRELVGMS